MPLIDHAPWLLGLGDSSWAEWLSMHGCYLGVQGSKPTSTLGALPHSVVVGRTYGNVKGGDVVSISFYLKVSLVL